MHNHQLTYMFSKNSIYRELVFHYLDSKTLLNLAAVNKELYDSIADWKFKKKIAFMETLAIQEGIEFLLTMLAEVLPKENINSTVPKSLHLFLPASIEKVNKTDKKNFKIATQKTVISSAEVPLEKLKGDYKNFLKNVAIKVEGINGAKEKLRWSDFHFAVLNSSNENIEALLETVKEIPLDGGQSSSFFYAAVLGQVQLLKSLLTHKSIYNDDAFYQALLTTIQYNYRAAFSVLLQEGKDQFIKLKNEQKAILIQLICKNARVDILHEILSYSEQVLSITAILQDLKYSYISTSHVPFTTFVPFQMNAFSHLTLEPLYSMPFAANTYAQKIYFPSDASSHLSEEIFYKLLYYCAKNNIILQIFESINQNKWVYYVEKSLQKEHFATTIFLCKKEFKSSKMITCDQFFHLLKIAKQQKAPIQVYRKLFAVVNGYKKLLTSQGMFVWNQLSDLIKQGKKTGQVNLLIPAIILGTPKHLFRMLECYSTYTSLILLPMFFSSDSRFSLHQVITSHDFIKSKNKDLLLENFSLVQSLCVDIFLHQSNRRRDSKEEHPYDTADAVDVIRDCYHEVVAINEACCLAIDCKDYEKVKVFVRYFMKNGASFDIYSHLFNLFVQIKDNIGLYIGTYTCLIDNDKKLMVHQLLERINLCLAVQSSDSEEVSRILHLYSPHTIYLLSQVFSNERTSLYQHQNGLIEQDVDHCIIVNFELFCLDRSPQLTAVLLTQGNTAFKQLKHPYDKLDPKECFNKCYKEVLEIRAACLEAINLGKYEIVECFLNYFIAKNIKLDRDSALFKKFTELGDKISISLDQIGREIAATSPAAEKDPEISEEKIGIPAPLTPSLTLISTHPQPPEIPSPASKNGPVPQGEQSSVVILDQEDKHPPEDENKEFSEEEDTQPPEDEESSGKQLSKDKQPPAVKQLPYAGMGVCILLVVVGAAAGGFITSGLLMTIALALTVVAVCLLAEAAYQSFNFFSNKAENTSTEGAPKPVQPTV